MRLILFFKTLIISLVIALGYFAVTPAATIIFLLKTIALGIAASIVLAVIYPEIRGIRTGDAIAVINTWNVHSIIARVGRALTSGRKNTQIRVRLENGEEVVGIIESYDGIVSPPKIRVMYEERLAE